MFGYVPSEMVRCDLRHITKISMEKRKVIIIYFQEKHSNWEMMFVIPYIKRWRWRWREITTLFPEGNIKYAIPHVCCLPPLKKHFHFTAASSIVFSKHCLLFSVLFFLFLRNSFSRNSDRECVCVFFYLHLSNFIFNCNWIVVWTQVKRFSF